MKKFKYVLILFLFSVGISRAEQSIPDIKENAFALYNTNHQDEAYKLLMEIPEEKRDFETLLIMANIEEDLGKSGKSLVLTREAIKKNPKYYKGYYNLGCFFMKKKIYNQAITNFKNALKYNKENAFIYYNLGCAQMNLGEFKSAKRNFIKAIYLKNDEKDFYYNLAYVDKKLGKKKDAQKIIDFYNEKFVK